MDRVINVGFAADGRWAWFFEGVTLSDSAECPRCGSTLPPEVPEGLCPACLMQQGLEDYPSTGGESARATVTALPDVDGVRVDRPVSRMDTGPAGPRPNRPHRCE